MAGEVTVEYGTKTILDLRSLQENGHLNLEPGFQRKSVWKVTDRRKLIQSVLEGYPVPSIFLYRREENGVPMYDVLDGKQRLETIFMFSRLRPFNRLGFGVKFEFFSDEGLHEWDWKSLERWERTANVLMYKIQVAEVSGSLSDIVDLFVRINSTGKALTTSEKRHATFYNSLFLKEAERLARRHREFLTAQRIVSATDIDRMRDVELVSELLASIASGGPIHKKQAVDKAIGNEAAPPRELKKAIDDFSATLRAVRQVCPSLKSTRFKNSAEFYTLFLVIWQMLQQKLIFNNRRLNSVAADLLQQFSDGVDAVREQQRKARGPTPEQQVYVDYLMLTQQSTDNLAQRRRRAEMIEQLLSGLFEAKDERRIFSPEQRRLLWNSDEKKCCSLCGVRLDWNNFQVDHIAPHSRGGKTDLANAALACSSCNTSKGAGRNGRR